MRLNNDMCKVIADLEYCVGKECYNRNSYDGWADIQGCSFRYPVSISNEEGEDIKLRENINMFYDLDTEDICRMKYKFGSNQLFIGKGIANVLNYLEKRYNLNFNALENDLAAE